MKSICTSSGGAPQLTWPQILISNFQLDDAFCHIFGLQYSITPTNHNLFLLFNVV